MTDPKPTERGGPVTALREALVAFGDHREGCEYGPALRCTCGWLDALRAFVETGDPNVRTDAAYLRWRFPTGVAAIEAHAVTDWLQSPEAEKALAAALHDTTPPELDGGVPDVCNLFPEHERDARAILAALREQAP